MSERSLIPLELRPLRSECRRTAVEAPWPLRDGPSIEMLVGKRRLFALTERSGAAVMCGQDVAFLYYEKGAKSIMGMRRGLVINLNRGPIRVWRPAFGLALASRVLRVEGPGIGWAIVPETSTEIHSARGRQCPLPTRC